MKTHASAHGLRVSPRKMALTARVVKGMGVRRAITELSVRPTQASRLLLKCLRSAVANAQDRHHLDPSGLTVSAIWVGQGPRFKRFQPRAYGRANPIRTPTTHVTVWVEGEKMVVVSKALKAIEKKHYQPRDTGGREQPAQKEHIIPSMTTPQGPQKKSTIFRRFFQRKSGM